MTKPEDIPQDIWDAADECGIWNVVVPSEPLKEVVARSLLAERDRCALKGRSAVMKFRARVGGKYYPGYHEDLRDAVAAAIREANP